MKYFSFLLCIFFSFSCFANNTHTICNDSGSVALVLHKDIDGNVSEKSNNYWSVTLPYDILSGSTYDGSGTNVVIGYAICSVLSVKSTADGSSYDGGTAVPGDVNTFARMETTNQGNKCWCKMDGPITSWWTFVHEYENPSTCASSCTSYCADGFAKNTQMTNGRHVRNALIDAVW